MAESKFARKQNASQGASERNEPAKTTPIVATTLPTGELVELCYDPKVHATALVVGRGDEWRVAQRLRSGDGRGVLAPLPATHSAVSGRVVLLPERPREYGTSRDLYEEVLAFVRSYVDLDARFERIAVYYVLLTWMFDRFRELPYLRVKGDFGTGKTRFLLTLGAVCYRPIFASGASTVAPLFHLLDEVGGTLILDEADFPRSDEKADIVKILNNGNVRGVPVLRMEATAKGAFQARAYNVFSPKLIATRGELDDRALESRFITAEMGGAELRSSIPVALPDEHEEEARQLRNKLLLFRLRNRFAPLEPTTIDDESLEPRVRQIFSPLESIIEDPSEKEALRAFARAYQEELVADRGLEVEAELIAVLREALLAAPRSHVPLREIAKTFGRRAGADIERHVTPRWVGTQLRRRLGIRATKSNGVYGVPFTEWPRVERIAHKYGAAARRSPAPESLPGAPEAADVADRGDRNGDPS